MAAAEATSAETVLVALHLRQEQHFAVSQQYLHFFMLYHCIFKVAASLQCVTTIIIDVKRKHIYVGYSFIRNTIC
jgi:hypothetical protein